MLGRLLLYLQRLDRINRYTIILDRADPEPWRPEVPNFATLLVDIPHHSFAEQVRLLKVLNKIDADLVHFFMPQQPLGYRGRKITSIHDLTILRIDNPGKSRAVVLVKRVLGKLVFRHGARTSEAVICCSKYTRDDVIRTLGAPPERIHVIYDAADASPGDVRPGPAARQFLLFVGRQAPYKNILRLCDAHHLLRAEFPDLELVLAGAIDGDAEATRRYCLDRNYHGVTFTGRVPDAERDQLYAQCAAYVFPSLAEGFGLPGLEAMGYGAPVVSSDATCLPEIYGDAALYFDPRDANAMATAIRRVLTEPALRRDLITAGERCFASYSWERMARQTHALYTATTLRSDKAA